MQTLSLRIIFDRKNETKKDPNKKALLQIEVYDRDSQKKVYISTGVKILRSQYSTTGGFTIKNHPNGPVLKSTVYKIYNQVEAFAFSDKCVSLQDIKNWDKSDEQLTTSVVDFINEDLKKRNPSDAVWEYNRSFLTRLEEFGRIKTFKDLTYSNIEEFDFFLKKYIKSQPTLYKRHSLFKGYIEKARKRGVIKTNPYDEFRFKKGKSEDPVYLIESEVKKIIKYTPVGPTKESLERIKDLFLFQCYTGLAYSDLEDFRKDKIVKVNDQEEIHGMRIKTGVPYVVLLLSIAKEILEKYDYQLPVITNQKYNEYLAILIERVGIRKNVTTHTGRHTFGTYLINKGVSIEAIPKIMGHTNMKQSLLYARMLGVTAVNEMKNKLL
ncbi:MAG: site-specific integrase [Tannerellaceae bacterium]|nr:site-specific integrase [Tannerellaceae bacterium]